MPTRQFNAYEYNQLIKHGLNPESLSAQVGNTPVEYITGFAEFLGHDFKVNNHTLVPRVETEQIIELGLNAGAEKISSHRQIKFIDVGTGSGAIGISFGAELLKRGIHFNAYLSDFSKAALKVTKQNAKDIFDLNVPVYETDDDIKITVDKSKFDSVVVVESNLLKNISQNKFDVIFANLPYIPSERIVQLDSSVKDFEPLTALDGGADGLKLIRELLNQALQYLAQNGSVILEVDDTHTNASEFEDRWHVQIIKDVNDKNRFWVMTLR